MKSKNKKTFDTVLIGQKNFKNLNSVLDNIMEAQYR